MIVEKQPNIYTVRVSYRNQKGGAPCAKQVTVYGSKKHALLKEIELKLYVENLLKSGKVTFANCCDKYRRVAKPKGFDSLFSALIYSLGECIIDKLFFWDYSEYIARIETELSQRTGRKLSIATVNRHKACIRMVINYAVKAGMVDKNPIPSYGIKSERGRTRILTQPEESRILSTLEKNKSFLLPAYRFSMLNPVRIGDLTTLTRDNLDLSNRMVRFYQEKSNSATLLCIWDDWIEDYFKNLPKDCPYLFYQKTNHGYKPIKNYAKHWATMLKHSGVSNFRWHDLRRCAATKMIHRGALNRDFLDLGLWGSHEMISRYYQGDAMRAAKRVCVDFKNAQDEQLLKAVSDKTKTGYRKQFSIEPANFSKN